MKIVSVLLALIILTLSAIPCDDAVSIEENTIAQLQLETSEAGFNTNHTEEHPETDLCSPFCTCVCCASIVLKPIISYPELAAHIPSNRLETRYSALFSNDYLSYIFQPPQV